MLLLDVGDSGRRQQRRQPVLQREGLVGDGAGRDVTGPARQHRDAVRPFPVAVLLAAEGGHATVRPGEDFRPVVGEVEDDRVLRDAEVVKLLEQLPDVAVVLDHAVGVDADARLAQRLLLQMREDMHARRIEPHEERLLSLDLALDEVLAGREEFLVDGLHALGVERTGVLDLAIGVGMDHAAGAILLLELRIFRIEISFGFLLGIQVIEVAKEFIESVIRREMFITVA